MKNRRFLLIGAIVLIASLLIAGLAMADAIKGVTFAPASLSKELENNPYHSYQIDAAGEIVPTLDPAAPDPFYVEWSSSDTSVAYLDYDGTSSFSNWINSRKPGKATITMKVYVDGKYQFQKTIDVEFKEVAITSFTQTATKIELGKNESQYLTMYLSGKAPANATYDETNGLDWTSSDMTIVTVDSDGEAHAKKAGTATITAALKSDATKKWTFDVTVVDNPITGVKLNLTEIKAYEGDPWIYLSATKEPADASGKLKWTISDPKVASLENTVSNYNYVTPIKAGTATITVASQEDPSVKATCTITVIKNPITGLTLSQTEFNLFEGEGIDASAYLTQTPLDGNGIINWTSSDPQIASVDGWGNITANKAGTATITAYVTSDPTIKATATVTVKANNITALAFSQDKVSINVRDSLNLREYLTVAPLEYGEDGVVWTSSDISVATVDYGEVYPIKPGTVTITAASFKNPAIKAEATITIEAINATAIAFTQSALEFEQGDYDDYGLNMFSLLTITPIDANYKEITFSSSDRDVVELDGNYGAGTWVWKTKVGTATITATWKNYDDSIQTATTTITVKAPPITGFAFTKTEYKLTTSSKPLDLGRRLIIKPDNRKFQEVFDDDPDNLVWESDDEMVAVVDENGKVVPVHAGTATITVTYAYDEAIKATATVTVADIPVKKVALNKTKLEMSPEDTARSQKIKLTYSPGNAFVKEIYWTNSDPSVVSFYDAEIVDNGSPFSSVLETYEVEVVPTGKVGTATITAFVNDGTTVHQVSCEVTVKYPKAKVALANKKVTLSVVKDKGVDGINNLYYFENWNKLLNNDPDSNKDYLPSNFSWKSSAAKVAKVDKKGNITVLKKGKAVITGTLKKDKSVTVKCTVTVTQTKIKSISAIDRTLRIGDVADLFGSCESWIVLKPKETSRVRLFNPELKITSSDPKVVSVKNGKLSALKAGTVTITVKATDGSKKKTTFTVNVVKNVDVDE